MFRAETPHVPILTGSANRSEWIKHPEGEAAFPVPIFQTEIFLIDYSWIYSSVTVKLFIPS
jgi:hypothetical protein